MKNYYFFIFIFLFSSFSVSAARVAFTDSPARAQWLEENKLKLLLPNNLNVNGVQLYFLKNDTAHARVPLYVNNSHDRTVELEVKSFNQAELTNLISGPLSLIATTLDGEILDETSVQLAGILDQRFFYGSNDLGAQFHINTISLKIWSPTASAVQVYLFKNSDDQTPEIILNLNKEEFGTWVNQLSINYKNYYYLYRISVYSPNSKTIENNFVTDPYSYSLSINSQKSQLVDVYDNNLKPAGWNSLVKKQTLNKIIYETHLRDLTADDQGLSEDDRGTFIGLSKPSSLAYQHLKTLADSGLTHIHFLPLNDFASVNEDRSLWQTMDLTTNYPSGSDKPQSQLNRIRNNDSYNWGYDPYHYFVPDGSYSKNPNGSARIKELRTLVLSLNQIGLKTIVDVVFNHTYSSGTDSYSVLNKIVPLYYYRLNESGNIYNSSCCSDTASEHKMMEKLMIDSILFWAKVYKVDGFRFDLMSFHTRENLLKIKSALSQLTMSADGVNGPDIYLYGEGWNFGSLVETDPRHAFTQLNSYGAGIGFFNDRFRDAIRGGTTDSSEKSDQGFATGLFTDFNKEIANRNTSTNLNDQKTKLNILGDIVKIGLAGNLRDFRFKNFVGDIVTAKDYYFRGVPTGYAATTDETINYVSAHDGYCLWDAISAKAPFYTPDRIPTLTSSFDKQRMQQLALGFTLLSQGIPFIEGGSEILRSKSGDVDSYDSGDWFNHLSFDLQDNNWGKGLPPSFKNYNDWSFWFPRLNEQLMKPTRTDILANLEVFKSLLKIRTSSTLFNPKNSLEVSQTINFIDNDISPNTGIIAFELINNKEEMLILFNVNKNQVQFNHPIFNKGWKLHPGLTAKVDQELINARILPDNVLIPARSIMVLVPNSIGKKLK